MLSTINEKKKNKKQAIRHLAEIYLIHPVLGGGVRVNICLVYFQTSVIIIQTVRSVIL